MERAQQPGGREEAIAVAGVALALGLALGCGGGGKTVVCTPGLTDCGGVCSDLARDRANCGACGLQCTAGTCSGGNCSCPAPTTYCGPAGCVDTATSAAHCGNCDHDCGAGTCSGGACACSTATGVMDCGVAASPQCRGVLADRFNCGNCGVVCLSGEICASGVCQPCVPPLPDRCGNACVDTATDPANCGACGKVCGAAQTCTAGGCLCPVGLDPCGAACVDLQTDAANCGRCGRACPTDQTCSAGACACTAGATCGSSCCPAGSACSCSGGTSCQTKHDNGLDQFFYDCNPLDTFTLASAQAAATAWSAAGSTAVAPCLNCYAWQTTSPDRCGTWCYEGSSFPGQVTVNKASMVCLCPPGPGPVTNWH